VTTITEAEEARRRAAVIEGAAAGETLRATAARLGLQPSTFNHWKDARGGIEAITGGIVPVKPVLPPVEEAPTERHDSTFWRRKASELQRERDEMHALIRELGALDGLKLRAPSWRHEPDTSRTGAATLIVHNSDRHYGEVIRADEINGWNAYSVQICEDRVRRFMTAACELGRRWPDDTTVDGVLYTMGGDEVSGDIHDELRETNEITSLEQVRGSAELHVACLRLLADEWGRVHVVAVPGNHGRTTKKPTAKRYGALSYDTMIAKMVARDLRDDERISFDIAAGPDAVTLLYGRTVLTSHGDKIGSGGGMGFAGPVLPIIRGANKVAMQYGSTGTSPDLMLIGHFHTSAAPPGILANGSVPGYSEFGNAIRARFDTPRQWLAVMRSRWGLAERCDVQLEEPVRPAKPRVRLA